MLHTPAQCAAERGDIIGILIRGACVRGVPCSSLKRALINSGLTRSRFWQLWKAHPFGSREYPSNVIRMLRILAYTEERRVGRSCEQARRIVLMSRSTLYTMCRELFDDTPSGLLRRQTGLDDYFISVVRSMRNEKAYGSTG